MPEINIGEEPNETWSNLLGFFLFTRRRYFNRGFDHLITYD